MENIQAIKQRFGIIGNDLLLNRAIEKAIRVAPTDISVLVTGESGVGKENIPKIIHQLSHRKHAKYIAVNCGAIPEGTIDSELFGHEKGAFTGATTTRKGYFEVADGGTIFLDEVGELPLTTQVRLLRVLENGEFIKVGSSQVQKTNVRIVAATNVKMQEAIAKEKFREDLYYRLSTIEISLPALRNRNEDIHLLFRKFAADFAQKYRMPTIRLDENAVSLLLKYSFPGNIRQLKNIAEQISIVEESRLITPEKIIQYLPDNRSNLPAVIGGKTSNSDFANERDIMYKILFDMRNDINDLKKLTLDLMQDGNSEKVQAENHQLIEKIYQEKQPEHYPVEVVQIPQSNVQNNYDAALTLYRKVLALNPDSKDARNGIDSIRKIALDARKQSTLKQLVAMQAAFDKKQYALLDKLFAASNTKLSEFADLPQYWLLRAQFNYQQKHYAQAISSYKRLLHIKPDSVPARQGMILAFTQLKDFSALKQLLNNWERFAETHDKLWPNYAMAYQTMKDYQSSIKWFEMASIKHPENYIMLLSYAESLEKLNRKTEADQVRSFGVKQLEQQLTAGTLNPAERKEALFQYLTVTHKTGTQAQFNRIYAQLDRLTTDKADKDRMNEIAISWALDKNNLAQLKRLLARSDVKRMKKPLWMALSIALKLKDKRTLASLLKHSDQMSTSDHVSVLIALERQQEAFDVAKRAMNQAKTTKERDIARGIALSLAEGRVSEFVAAYNARKVGTLTTTEQVLQYKHGMGKNGIPVGMDIKLRKARLSDNTLPGTKINEQDVSIGFDWKDTTNQVNARLGIYDNGSDSKAYGNLKYQRQLNKRLNAGLMYGFQETPDENSYLRQYGRRNRLKVDFNAQLGEKQTAQLSAWKHEFNRTDNGQHLADGLGTRAAVVHRQNTLNGQWYGGVQGTLQKNRNASQVSAADALPESTQSVELIAGFNHGTPGQGLNKKSELQYSGSVALGKVWPTGEIKAHVEAAVSKDLFDNDELSLGVFYDKGSFGNPEDKGLLLQYRKFLDFPVTDK